MRVEKGCVESRRIDLLVGQTVACKDYYPDSEVFGRYDSFWQPADTQSDLRGQVGVRLNVPIYKGRLNAAVREAMFRFSQRRAEYNQKVLTCNTMFSRLMRNLKKVENR